MKTLQFTTHIENNAQLHLTLPAEYADQDVELVVIIQPRKEAMQRQNWLAFINQTYGCLADVPLQRPEQSVSNLQSLPEAMTERSVREDVDWGLHGQD